MKPDLRIVKAELLWTKRCPFSCSFCGMYQNERPEEDALDNINLWEKAFKNLKNIGCEFIAIYGAEPLVRLKGLSEIIKKQRELGIEQTIITALYKPEIIDKIIKESGLNSISVSYDLKALNDHRMLKSENGTKLLDDFKHLEDKACIATLTNENIDIFLDGVKDILDKGYWALFDIVHPGFEGTHEGYALSKCKGNGEILAKDKLETVFTQLIKWKEEGKRIHASVDLLKTMLDRLLNCDSIRECWHCKDENSLGWITLGPNRELYFCDDCQIPYKKTIDEMTDISDWEDFFEFRKIESQKCPGCLWNTHLGANICIDNNDLDTYVHTKGTK